MNLIPSHDLTILIDANKWRIINCSENDLIKLLVVHALTSITAIYHFILLVVNNLHQP